MNVTPEEIQALRALSVPELAAKYQEVWGAPARVKRQREYLWKRIAWRLETSRNGGLADLAKDRLERILAGMDIPQEENQRTVTGVWRQPPKPRPYRPVPGTALVRRWRGQEIRAVAVEGGWECGDQIYPSLSAVAKAVTGAHWNGRLFFGLTKRGARR